MDAIRETVAEECSITKGDCKKRRVEEKACSTKEGECQERQKG